MRGVEDDDPIGASIGYIASSAVAITARQLVYAKGGAVFGKRPPRGLLGAPRSTGF